MAQYEQQVELAMSADEAVHRLYGAISSLRGAGPPQVEGPWVTTQIGMSGFSWGETVAAYVQPGPDRCWVTVRSKSDFALVDWGKNKKNVQTVLDHMRQPRRRRSLLRLCSLRSLRHVRSLRRPRTEDRRPPAGGETG